MRVLVQEEVARALERGASIITANERAARSIRRCWDKQQHAAALKTWDTAPDLSWGAWLRSLWRDLLLQGVVDQLLLEPAQEHYLWRQVLLADPQTRHLRSYDALATMCAEAHRRLHLYSAMDRWRALRANLHGDAAAFAGWWHRFDERCRRERLATEASLALSIARNLSEPMVATRGKEILLLGFDTLLPSQQLLLNEWRTYGGITVVLSAPSPSAGGMLVQATDRNAELRAFARWARDRLAFSPDQSIALVVDDLAAERDEIESVLRELLSPELEDITRTDHMPFELSLGRPLCNEPLVRAAFDLLQWTRGPLPLERIERLLLGPALGDAAGERAARAALDRELRREPRLLAEATIEEVLLSIEQSTRLAYPLSILRRALRAVQRTAAALAEHTRQSFAAWVDFIRAILAASRWAEQLSSRTYQLRNRWEQVLDTLSTLGFTGGDADWSEMIEMLDRLTQTTIFAPQSHNAPVQVIGPAEAAGSLFDALWVLHAGEMDRPAGPATHPLLPAELEHALGLPGADREGEFRLRRAVTERLASSAPQVIFSFTGETSEGTEQRPAAEVASLDLASTSLAELAPEDSLRSPTALERSEDVAALPPLRGRAVRGGARVLELQAQCGFRAFAELRLQAKELQMPSFGLSPGGRGSTVHFALEEFWGRLGSQEALRALSGAERQRMLDEAIDLGLRRVTHDTGGMWARSYLEVQRERLLRLLNTWLDQELLRPAFTVRQREERLTVAVGPLDLAVRMDRVDLVDGAQVLLDYKTGAATTAQWRGPRPDRPQLPLYAMLTSQTARDAAAFDDKSQDPVPPLGAVAFANVVPGRNMGIQGFEPNGAELLPAGKHRATMDVDDFAQQVQLWAEVIPRLATEFAEGDARVWPKQFPTTCTHCGQRILCRVNPADFEEVLNEADETVEDDE